MKGNGKAIWKVNMLSLELQERELSWNRYVLVFLGNKQQDAAQFDGKETVVFSYLKHRVRKRLEEGCQKDSLYLLL